MFIFLDLHVVIKTQMIIALKYPQYGSNMPSAFAFSISFCVAFLRATGIFTKSLLKLDRHYNNLYCPSNIVTHMGTPRYVREV